MKKHVKIYMQYFDYGMDDIILCEACHRKAVDIHHIKYKSRGGKDEIKNLIALCRACHEKGHKEKLSESDLQLIHNHVLLGYNKQFIK